MASESNPPQREANLEGWISDVQKHQKYLHFWKERKVLKKKFIDLQWFTSYGFHFPQLIIEQGVQYLMELRGCYYTDFVRVFYFNLKVWDDIFHTRVKGVDNVLDNKIWTNVVQIPILENSQHIPSDFAQFNKIMVYSFLRNTSKRIQSCSMFWNWSLDHVWNTSKYPY